jgi:5-oxoprolinase (ATP-hydrolysing)
MFFFALTPMKPPGTGWQFWIDRGGTFTDIVARDPDGRLTTHKLLSDRKAQYDDAAVAGIRRALGLADGCPIPPDVIDAVKMGTTVATNALLERRGARTLLLVNEGFGDALLIGDQARPRLFDLAITLPPPLYERVAEISARIAADGTEVAPLDEAAVRAMLREARAQGIDACAIALMHAWKFPSQEQQVVELAHEAGFTQISASHEVSPSMRLIPRAQTAVVDATLTPVLRRHVAAMTRDLAGTKLYFMQSHGGLTGAASFRGKDAVLSGPAGGIVGAVRSAAQAGFDRVIGFDMGGTSTDVALYAGAFERSSVGTIAGVRIATPMLAINTVAAGGGSILHFDGARLRVGPDSAGANPGPAAYRNGGPLTVTDANICLGKLRARDFPRIFGPQGDAGLDEQAVHDGFATLADGIGRQQSPQRVAEGFLRIAVHNMAAAIRQISVQKGHRIEDFTLVCFGGAGGQHACLVAEELGMDTVLIPPFAGVLSAYGMGLADQTVLREQAVETLLDDALVPVLHAAADTLAQSARVALRAQGADTQTIVEHRSVRARYQGTEAALAVRLGTLLSMQGDFTEAHRTRFGFATPQRPIIVEAVAVEATHPGEPLAPQPPKTRTRGAPEPVDAAEFWSGGGSHAAGVFDRSTLCAGDLLAGPAIVREADATTIVEPGWRAEIISQGHIILRRTASRPQPPADPLGPADPVLLEMFASLFMTIAEEAGAVLQNTASSVNIKERLDFSCAIFDAQGNLVANAPHVPVHLGAMGASVKAVIEARGATLRPGDCVALNNPFRGGTHLPDITLVTPVFGEAEDIDYFVACRGHHADIGGATPGSTPPDSRMLEEEGVVIDDFLLMQAGSFREAEFRALLAGARYPARSPDTNVADIVAQIASNQASAQGLQRAVAKYGIKTVRAYMRHVMDNAAENIRRVIDRLDSGSFATVMDDGSPLHVAVRIDRASRNAIVDFTGTGPQRADNFNAPEAVTRAVVLYVFRCLAGTDMPLNDGCLEPLTIVIPPGTFLSPAPGAAVVAGNTEVSQAVCCALFGALGALASSQGTMNNFLFGNAGLQYYETICGGSGAGSGFDGQSAVQTHMTNTRMTDPEVLEMRYPVRVECFGVRRGSGGAGRWRGGDGAVRRIRFLAPMTAVLVSGSRVVAPFGLAGGEDGTPGAQWIDRADGTYTPMGGREAADMLPGDAITILTPGGGGFGESVDG